MMHHHFRRGTKVFVILTNGTKFYDTFIESGSKGMILRNNGRILHKAIRSITIKR